MTVAELIKTIDEKTFLVLTTETEDDALYLYTQMSVKGECSQFIKVYGMNKMSRWTVEGVSVKKEMEDVFIHIRYKEKES